MKKTWAFPLVCVQQFEANEYVAACWGVGCSVDEANRIERNLGIYQPGVLDHSSDHCGLSGNQVIYDDNNDGTADRMVEVGTDGLGTLNCTIYTDSSYSTPSVLARPFTGRPAREIKHGTMWEPYLILFPAIPIAPEPDKKHIDLKRTGAIRFFFI